MEGMLEPFGAVARGVRLRPPEVAHRDGADHLECERSAVQRGRADDGGVLGAARPEGGAVLSSGSNAGARRYRDVFGAWSAGGAFCAGAGGLVGSCARSREGVVCVAQGARRGRVAADGARRLVWAWAVGGLERLLQAVGCAHGAV